MLVFSLNMNVHGPVMILRNFQLKNLKTSSDFGGVVRIFISMVHSV